jgi:hypothetical protein
MTALMHGELMNDFLDFMKCDWEFGRLEVEYDPHEMITNYLGEYYTSNGILISDPNNKKLSYLQYYNWRSFIYEDGYDSCG